MNMKALSTIDQVMVEVEKFKNCTSKATSRSLCQKFW